MAQKAKVIPEDIWELIKDNYITGKIGFHSLSKKYNCPYVQIRSRANDEDWLSLREEYKKKIHEKAIDKIADAESEKIAKAFRCADAVLDKVEISIELCNPEDRDGLLKCTNILRGLKEIGVFSAELDRAEQEARIAKLRKDAKDDDKVDNTIIVRFEGDIEEYGD